MSIIKFIPYTLEQSEEITAKYIQGHTVESIAESIGRSPRSVIAKLVREGIYVSRTKPGLARASKSALVENIAKNLNLSIEIAATLEKATHETLQAVNDAIILAIK